MAALLLGGARAGAARRRKDRNVGATLARRVGVRYGGMAACLGCGDRAAHAGLRGGVDRTTGIHIDR